MGKIHKRNFFIPFQVRGQARQRVRPAVQLLSNSVAAAAERFCGRSEEAKFIRVLDRGLDALNAHNPTDPKELRRGMRADSREHQKALDDLEAAVRLPFEGKTGLLPFQKGFLVTIASMRGLVTDVTARLGPGSYVLTGRVNQDPLESFFSLVRGKGGACLHPSPSEARCRVRNITLMMALRLGVSPVAETVFAASPTSSGTAALAVPAAASSGTAAVPAAAPAVASSNAATPAAVVSGTATLSDPDTGDVDHAVLREFIEDSSTTGILSELQEAEALLATASQASPPPPVASSPLDPETGVSAEEYGLAHAAGYVSAKCRRVDATLGTPSALAGEAAPVEALWTRLISQGGLSVPSADWLSRFRSMEVMFCASHHLEPDGISRAPRVVESLVERLAAEPGALDARVIRRFVRLRTFIRMSHINRRRRAQTHRLRECRKRRQFAQ